MIRSLLCSLEQLLLPNACVCCDRLVERSSQDTLICGPCRARMRSVPLGCNRCRHPLPPVGLCRFCAGWPDVLQWSTSAFWLGEEARRVIHHLKYEGYSSLGRWMAEAIVRVVRRPESPLLCAIPLGSRRRRTRGYNQAAEIAAPLARLWSCPVDNGLLRRVRETVSQTSLTPVDRLTNVAGAFRARPADAGRALSSVILVDDVLTTGATIVAAARALEEAGWPSVGAVTFARAEPFVVRVDAA